MVGIRGIWDALFAYPRYMGVIKPSLRMETKEQLEARLASASIRLWPKKLSAPIGERILAISPHPDDESIGAGGLLLAHRGVANVHVLTVFTGDGGGRLTNPNPAELDPARAMVSARDQEIRRACDRLKADYLGCLGFSDGAPTADVLTASDRLAILVKALRPDVVILPSVFDTHPDHRAANLLWAKACGSLPCMVLGSEIWTLLQPNAYFEITEQMEEKLSLVAGFGTQTATIDYVGLVGAVARLRGFQEGCGRHHFGAAEAFFALPNRDYSKLAELMCS